MPHQHQHYRIAFGSCSHPRLDQPLWRVVASRRPVAFVWGGDSIYADKFEGLDWSQVGFLHRDMQEYDEDEEGDEDENNDNNNDDNDNNDDHNDEDDDDDDDDNGNDDDDDNEDDNNDNDDEYDDDDDDDDHSNENVCVCFRPPV